MNELDIKSKCVVFRNGVQIWIPEGEKLEKFQSILGNLQSHMFVNWDGRSMNTADITGVFEPNDMEDMQRRKNGGWKCKDQTWHDRGEKCTCDRSHTINVQLPEEEPITEEQRQKNVDALNEIRKKYKL